MSCSIIENKLKDIAHKQLEELSKKHGVDLSDGKLLDKNSIDNFDAIVEDLNNLENGYETGLGDRVSGLGFNTLYKWETDYMNKQRIKIDVGFTDAQIDHHKDKLEGKKSDLENESRNKVNLNKISIDSLKKAYAKDETSLDELIIGARIVLDKIFNCK